MLGALQIPPIGAHAGDEEQGRRQGGEGKDIGIVLAQDAVGEEAGPEVQDGRGHQAHDGQQYERPPEHAPSPGEIARAEALGHHAGDGGGHAGGGDDQQPGIEREHDLIVDHARFADDIICPDADEHADDLAQDPGKGKDGCSRNKGCLLRLFHRI